MSRIVAAILATAFLCACAPRTDVATAAPQSPRAAAPMASLDLAPGACEAAGGKITKVCRRQNERCVAAFADAGKRCTDGDQCQGDCLLEGDAKPGQALVGACQKDTNPCGCFAPLIGGKVSDRARCVD